MRNALAALARRLGPFRELGPLGLYVTPDAVWLCWRRVTKLCWNIRPRLAERLQIAALKIARGNHG